MSDSRPQKGSRPSQKPPDQGDSSSSNPKSGDSGTIGPNPSAEVTPLAAAAAAAAGPSVQSSSHPLPVSSRPKAQTSALTQSLKLPTPPSLPTLSSPSTRPGLAPIPPRLPTQASALTAALKHPARSLTPQELIDLAFPSPPDPSRSALPSRPRAPKQTSTGEDTGLSSSAAANSRTNIGGASKDAAARGGDSSRPAARGEGATEGGGRTGANRTTGSRPDESNAGYVLYARELKLLEEVVERAMYEIECLAGGQPLNNPKYEGIPSSQIYCNANARIADGKLKIEEVERCLREMGVHTRPPGPDRFSTERFHRGHGGHGSEGGAPGVQDFERPPASLLLLSEGVGPNEHREPSGSRSPQRDQQPSQTRQTAGTPATTSAGTRYRIRPLHSIIKRPRQPQAKKSRTYP